MLLWIINNFPARSSLSGWRGQGYKACTTCNEDTMSCRVSNKVVYVGHDRRFLNVDHPWRKILDYNGEHETRGPPRQFSQEEIQVQHARLLLRPSGKVAAQRAGIKKDNSILFILKKKCG